MQITYDTKADALYIKLREGKFGSNKEVAEGIVLDLDADNAVLGIEILEASTKLRKEDLARIDIRMPLDLAPVEG